jgi:hypothetical protein
MPFGYPSGRKLVELIIDGCEDGRPLAQELRAERFQSNEINELQHYLLNSHHESIDAFLEHNSDFSDIGKCAIVAEIRRANPALRHSNWDWYSELWRALSSNANVESFADNKLSVVTFNYDCSFEHFLGNAIIATFRRSASAHEKLLQTVPIEHVYGKIPFRVPGNADRSLREMSAGIKIIHDQTGEEDPGIIRARKLISDAKRVCILGFGFHETNLLRLSIHKSCLEKNLLGNRLVYATCKGFTDAELWDLGNRCVLGTHLYVGSPNWTSRTLIREFGVFLPQIYIPSDSYNLFQMSLRS